MRKIRVFHKEGQTKPYGGCMYEDDSCCIQATADTGVAVCEHYLSMSVTGSDEMHRPTEFVVTCTLPGATD